MKLPLMTGRLSHLWGECTILRLRGVFFLTNQRCTCTFIFFARCTKALICEYNLHLSLKLLWRQNISVQHCFWTTGIFCLLLTCSLSIGTLYNSLLPSFWEKKKHKRFRFKSSLSWWLLFLQCTSKCQLKAFHALRWC